MRGKTTELEQLAVGLGNAEDPLNLKELLSRTIEDLADHVDGRIRYTALDMVDQGRYFHAIKEKCAHGTWESFVQKRGWSWHYVHACMKLVVVVAEFPQALHLSPGRATVKLLGLPPPAIKEILKDLSPETIKKLTPWDLEHAHYDYVKEKAAQKRKKKKRTPEDEARLREILERKKAEDEDPMWVAFESRWIACLRAMGGFAQFVETVEIKSEWYDRIFEHELLEKLGRCFDGIAKRLHPIDEVMKRAEVIETKGHAATR